MAGVGDVIHPTKEDLEEYKRQDAEDKGIAHHEERRRREPPIGEPCERCDGEGKVECAVKEWSDTMKCPRCHGEGVEP